MIFSLTQAAGAYGMSFALTRIGTYRPLFAAGAAVEAIGAAFCILAMVAGRR